MNGGRARTGGRRARRVGERARVGGWCEEEGAAALNGN